MPLYSFLRVGSADIRLSRRPDALSHVQYVNFLLEISFEWVRPNPIQGREGEGVPHDLTTEQVPSCRTRTFGEHNNFDTLMLPLPRIQLESILTGLRWKLSLLSWFFVVTL